MQFSAGKELVQTVHNDPANDGIGFRFSTNPVFYVLVEWQDEDEMQPPPYKQANV